VHAVYGGIKRGIRVAIENQCYGSAVVLILSGIDTMAYLGMPAEQQDVTRRDFVEWVEKYLKLQSEEQVTGLELYAARCGMLHSHSTQSAINRNRECRQIGYISRFVSPVLYNPEVSEDLVLVSIEALAEAFYEGIDRFLVDVYLDRQRAEAADARFQYVVQEMEANESAEAHD